MQQPITQGRQPVNPPPGQGMDAALQGMASMMGVGAEGAGDAVTLPPGLTRDYFIGKAAHCNRKFDEFFQTKYLANIKDNLRILNGKQPDGSLPNGTQLPLPQSILHTAQARLTKATLQRPRHVQATPETTPLLPGLSSDEQQCYELWVNQAIDLIPDFANVFGTGLQNACQEGVGVMEAMWRVVNEEAGTLQMAPKVGADGLPVLGPDGKPIMEPAGINTLNRKKGRLELDPCSLFELAWDPRETRRFSRSSWIRRRRMASANELLRLEAEGIIQDAQLAIDTAPREDGSAPQMQPGSKDPAAERNRAVLEQNLPVLNFEDGVFQLDNFYATVSWKNTETGLWETKDFNFWIVGGQVLVRLRESWMKNGRKPFLTMPMLKREEGLVGMTMVDLVKDALRDLATTSSRFNRVAYRVAETPTLYGVGSGLNAKSKVLQENSLMSVFDVDQVKLAPIPSEILLRMKEHMVFLIGEIQRGTPANDQAQGLQQKGVDTATEAEILQSGSSTRFDWMAGVLCNGFFPELASFLQEAHAAFGQEEDLSYRTAGLDGAPQLLPMELLLRPWRYMAEDPIEDAFKQRRAAQIQNTLTTLLEAKAKFPQNFVLPDGRQVDIDLLGTVNDKLLPLQGLESKGILTVRPALPAAPVAAMGQPIGAPAPAPGPGGPPAMPPPAPGGPALPPPPPIPSPA